MEVLPFMIAVVLQYHYHDSLPWWVWFVVWVEAAFNQSMTLRIKKEEEA